MLVYWVVLLFGAAFASDCNVLKTKNGSVCVCNSTQCDSFPQLSALNRNQYQIYTTSKEKLGYWKVLKTFENVRRQYKSPHTIRVNRNRRLQTIIGFGGAFTDATGINILAMSGKVQSLLVESLFGATGNAYTLCRFPIGGTDFSLRNYSLNDAPDDTTLNNFSLQQEDFNYRIPFIKQAINLTKQQNLELRLFGTAWTAPIWMKSNHDWTGVGVLLDQYYQTWADYHLKCIEAYDKLGIPVWGLTTGNEPSNGFVQAKFFRLNDMGWTVFSASYWIANNLGPTIRNSTYNKTKIIVFDDNMVVMPFAQQLLQDEGVLKYADGIGVHWYNDDEYPANFLEFVTKPGIFMLNTEACNGFETFFGRDVAVVLGSWERGEKYLANIIMKLRYHGCGWLEWNMVLDLQGGPTMISNFVDASIIVNPKTDEFYKQPMYYILGHFSKFVIPGSIMIEVVTSIKKDIDCVAFLRPDHKIVIIVYNWGTPTNVLIEESGRRIVLNLEAKSLKTVIYNA